MTNVFVAEDQVVGVVQESDQAVTVLSVPTSVQAFASPSQQIQQVAGGEVTVLSAVVTLSPESR